MAPTPAAPPGIKHSQSIVANEDNPMARAHTASLWPSETPDKLEVQCCDSKTTSLPMKVHESQEAKKYVVIMSPKLSSKTAEKYVEVAA